MRLLIETVGVDNVLYATEMFGTGQSTDPRTGRPFDDTHVFINAIEGLSEADKGKIFEENARKVYPRLAKALA
jgi:4-oxalmesaconate hydratase